MHDDRTEEGAAGRKLIMRGKAADAKPWAQQNYSTIRAYPLVEVREMVEFLPFRGLIPRLAAGESIEARASPPYDVIGPEELAKLQAMPCNVTRVTMGGQDSNYEEAGRRLRDWIDEGRLAQDDEDCYYVLRQTFLSQGRKVTRTGLVGALRLEPYEGGRISPHEETSPKVKEDRLNLLRAASAHLESIFCLYDRLDEALLREMASQAEGLFSLTDGDGTVHSFARISDRALVSRLGQALAEKSLLIADGHHRYETALRYSQENPGDGKKGYVLATLVAGNDPGLTVMPTHRIFKNVEINLDDLLFRASKFFAIWEARSMEELMRMIERNSRTSLGAIMPGGQKFIMELAWRPNEDPLWSVDAYVCEELVLKKILQKKGDVLVEYDHDAASAAAKASGDGVTMVVLLSPPRMDLIWAVAREGEKMPRKSTYFFPKVWSGFVAYDMI